ncbi:MAG: hypothetical protein AAGE59_38690 [Cyanobacteria bacterium P01_F01_bin.86]
MPDLTNNPQKENVPDIILHLKTKDTKRDFRGLHLQFYKVLRAITEKHGINLNVRARDADIGVGTRAINDDRFNDGNLHIIDDRSVIAANVLNSSVAYFWKYWHLDGQGTKAFSSIGNEHYKTEMMSYRRARIFFEKMRFRYVEKRRSKYAQPTGFQQFPGGSVSVFFQGQYPISAGTTKFMNIKMLKTVPQEVGDRPIIVKPRLKASSPEDKEKAKDIASRDDRVVIVDANVHDILASSAATVSINSTVALEGFLHYVPAILFGKSDFKHFASTVTEKRSFKDALDQELQRADCYEQYFAWYFLKNCIPLNSGRLEERIWKSYQAPVFLQNASPKAKSQRRNKVQCAIEHG